MQNLNHKGAEFSQNLMLSYLTCPARSFDVAKEVYEVSKQWYLWFVRKGIAGSFLNKAATLTNALFGKNG